MLDRQASALELSLKSDFLKLLTSVSKKIIKLGKSTSVLKDLRSDLNALASLTFTNLLNAVESSFKGVNIADNSPSSKMLSDLKESIYIFSGFKSYQMLRQATTLLVDKEGKIKSFAVYLSDIKALNELYNVNYLKAEYQHAVGSSEMAVKWVEIWQDKELFDLEYVATNDQRTRPEHKKLNGIVAPVEGDFWSKYYPPLGWGCRCTVKRVPKGTKKMTDLSKITLPEIPKMFATNTAKNGVVFPENHPYFLENEARKLESQIKSALYE